MLQASRLYVTAVVIAQADDDAEVEVVLPAGTTRFLITSPGTDAFRVAFQKGQTKDGGKYLSIPARTADDQVCFPWFDGLVAQVWTIYVRAPEATRIEIVSAQ